MSTEILPEKSEFQIMDDADSQQIQEAESAVKQALAYVVKGKKQLSYMGIKWIVLKMSQKEQPIEVIDMPQIELVKHEVDNKSKTGVITSGISFEYAKEAFGDTVSYLKLGFTYPLPSKLISDFCDKYEKIYIIEENDPYIEEFVKILGKECIGKDLFPYTGEMTPDIININLISTRLL